MRTVSFFVSDHNMVRVLITRLQKSKQFPIIYNYMGNNVRIRCAHNKDLPWIVNELKSFSAFFQSKKPLFNSEEHAFKTMQAHIDSHILLVAENDTGLLGFISGVYSDHVFNPAIKVLNETFWWVPEKYRGSRAGLLLLNAFTEIGKQSSDWVIFTLEHHSPVNERCLTKRGYGLRERNYMLEVA